MRAHGIFPFFCSKNKGFSSDIMKLEKGTARRKTFKTVSVDPFQTMVALLEV